MQTVISLCHHYFVIITLYVDVIHRYKLYKGPTGRRPTSPHTALNFSPKRPTTDECLLKKNIATIIESAFTPVPMFAQGNDLVFAHAETIGFNYVS